VGAAARVAPVEVQAPVEREAVDKVAGKAVALAEPAANPLNNN
jgi:hypothetical protein